MTSLLLTGDDTRSDDRGPEPEGVVVEFLNGRPLAFVTVERPGAIAVFDLSEPSRPRLAGFHPSSWDGDTGPEGLVVVDQPDPIRVVVAVCYEASGTLVIYEVREHTVQR